MTCHKVLNAMISLLCVGDVVVEQHVRGTVYTRHACGHVADVRRR
jgi:hypothetical protein